MVANTKEEENRQTNENGKQSFKIFPALDDKIRVGRNFLSMDFKLGLYLKPKK